MTLAEYEEDIKTAEDRGYKKLRDEISELWDDGGGFEAELNGFAREICYWFNLPVTKPEPEADRDE